MRLYHSIPSIVKYSSLVINLGYGRSIRSKEDWAKTYAQHAFTEGIFCGKPYFRNSLKAWFPLPVLK